MLNTTDFTKRLQIILEEYELSAAGFAQKIEVGRASISHILSGRNKPSLDFVMKVIKVFPEVDLYWLLNGKGSFPKTSTPPLLDTKTPTPSFPSESKTQQKVSSLPDIENTSKSKEINKIVIFYTDGSFEAYDN